MDYPKSVPNVGLVGGKFVDENTSTGQVGSLIPSAWGTAVTDEILNVIKDAALAPKENENNQLIVAIKEIIKKNTAGRLVNISSFTSSGTFTPNANTKMLRVRAIGGGGSGGYSLATAAGQTSTGTGGDAGVFGEIWVVSGITPTSVSVGAGGVGAGGGQSAFGSLLVCPGGAAGINGGAFAPPNQNVRTGAILQPTGSGVFVVKGAGNGGLNGISLSASFAQGGSGGNTQYGGGGQGAINGIGGGGIGYGSGGGGAACLPSTGAQAGGNGASGIVIIEEYS